jgi:LmbE family N-acetylglucosaminyl deacetylase
VQVVIATDSTYGHFEAGADPVAVRRRESAAAAEVLGYGRPVFWGLPDRQLQAAEGLVERILEATLAHETRIVYAPSWWEIHPDHRAIAWAATEAVRQSAAAPLLCMYEVGMPLYPNCLLDITALLDRKKAATACFSSQLAVQQYDRQSLALNIFRTYTLPAAVEAAEAFRMLAGRELKRQPTNPGNTRPCALYGIRFQS